MFHGLFTLQLDFGTVFSGAPRYLEVWVRPGNSSGSYSLLSPRQALTPAPYALYPARAPSGGSVEITAVLNDSTSGLTGYFTSSSGTAVNGTNTTTGNYGELGRSSDGLHAVAFTNNANGVYAQSTAGDGVNASSSGANRSGVYGANNTAGGYGLYGVGGHYRVHGETSNGKWSAGVHGISTAANGVGVFGEAGTGADSWGIYGKSYEGYGAVLEGRIGMFASAAQGGPVAAIFKGGRH